MDFQAFSNISLTTELRKFLEEIILPMRESSHVLDGWLGGIKVSLLSAQLQISVLAISSSIDWEGRRLSAMRLGNIV